jgi:hypothetical protein
MSMSMQTTRRSTTSATTKTSWPRCSIEPVHDRLMEAKRSVFEARRNVPLRSEVGTVLSELRG